MTSLGYIGAGGNVRRLPYDAEVEYLENTGMQWIDTGVVCSGHLDIAMRYQIVSFTANDNIAFYGCVSGTGGFFSGIAKSSNHYCYFINDTNLELISLQVVLNNIFSDSTNGTTFNHNAQSVTTVAQSPVQRTLPIFGRKSSNGATERIGTLKVYHVLIYDNGVLVRDMIPVRFTNEIGVSEGAMYDRANPTVGMNHDGSARDDGLYRNQGTGAFLYGNDL